MQWISVKDRTPETEILATSVLHGHPSYGEYLVGWCGKDAESKAGYICESENEILYDVTHWRPLPELPKEAQDEHVNWQHCGGHTAEVNA